MVRSVVTIHSEGEITKDDSVIVENLSFCEIKLSFSFGHQKVQKEFLVLIVDHTITENALVLVHPEFDYVKLSQDKLAACATNTLENL